MSEYLQGTDGFAFASRLRDDDARRAVMVNPKVDAVGIPALGRRRGGCGRPLARGQWWLFCGESDMGQTAPVLCTECGGDMVLSDKPNIRFIEIDADKVKPPTMAIKVRSGRAIPPLMRALGAMIARVGQRTDYGTIKVELTDEEVDRVGGLVIYTERVMEVTLK